MFVDINPLLSVLVYAIVFPYIMRIKVENYLIYLITGIIPWTFFTSSINMGIISVLSNANMIKKVYFPRIILPISTVTSCLVNFMISCLIILVFCTACLTSCGMLRELKVGKDEAIILVEDFCTALSNDDLDAAKGYLHPDSTPKQDDLSAFIAKLEQTHGINFSDGVAFKRRTDSSMTYYDSRYGGGVYEIGYEIVVGGVATDFFFVVVKNDNGYGLCNFGIEK